MGKEMQAEEDNRNTKHRGRYWAGYYSSFSVSSGFFIYIYYNLDLSELNFNRVILIYYVV